MNLQGLKEFFENSVKDLNLALMQGDFRIKFFDMVSSKSFSALVPGNSIFILLHVSHAPSWEPAQMANGKIFGGCPFFKRARSLSFEQVRKHCAQQHVFDCSFVWRNGMAAKRIFVWPPSYFFALELGGVSCALPALTLGRVDTKLFWISHHVIL